MAWIVDGAKTVVAVALLLLAGLGAFAVWNYFFGNKLEERRITFIQSARETDKLFSGFAYVSLLGIESKGHKSDSPLTDDWAWSEQYSEVGKVQPRYSNNPRNFTGVCGWFYRVGFGYHSREDAIRAYNARDVQSALPTILTVEAVDVFTTGSSADIKRKCAEADQVLISAKEDHRHAKLLSRLSYDNLLLQQYASGCKTLAAFSEPHFFVKDETSEKSKKEGKNEGSTDRQARLETCEKGARTAAESKREKLIADLKGGQSKAAASTRSSGNNPNSQRVKVVAFDGLRARLDSLDVFVDAKALPGPGLSLIHI